MPELRGKRGSTAGPKLQGSAPASGHEREAPKKKNLRLHQSKIDEAKAILGTATETETIETALDLVVFRQELVEGVRTMRGANLVNLFEPGAE